MDKHFNYKLDDLFEPILNALKKLGGSGSVSEIENEVSSILGLSEDAINEIHRESRTKLSYRLAWARTYLKRFGLIESSSRGVWSLSKEGRKSTSISKKKIRSVVHAMDKKEKLSKKKDAHIIPVAIEERRELDEFCWQDKLIETIKNIDPEQFERLCQRLLRELGFVNVEVTGKTNDGGIDGKGMLRLGGVLSFHVVFQAKRYKGTVSSSVIRDFRGAMSGRADKGVILTTGSFTREAKKEAQRDGAIPIDLIDGNDFAEKLKELGLGVSIELIEKVNVKTNWFKNI